MIDERARKLGDALVKAGVLKEDQLQKAIKKASAEGSPTLIISLLELEYLTYKVFERFLLASMNMRSAIILDHELNPALVSKVGVNLINSKLIFPISTRDEKGSKLLALGMVDPTDEKTIKKVETETGWRVIPILISLPDYRGAMEKNKAHIPALSEIDLKTAPGVFEIQLMEGSVDASTSTKPQIKIKGEDVLGGAGRKFREEVLAKLDLEPAEIPILKDSAYTRESLSKQLQKVSEKTLQRIYDRSDDGVKIEGLINLLMANGILKKNDILLSSAVSLVFKADGGKK